MGPASEASAHQPAPPAWRWVLNIKDCDRRTALTRPELAALRALDFNLRRRRSHDRDAAEWETIGRVGDDRPTASTASNASWAFDKLQAYTNQRIRRHLRRRRHRTGWAATRRCPTSFSTGSWA